MEEGSTRETTAIGEHVRVHTRREKERRKWGEARGGRRDGKRDTHGARRCTDGMKNEKEQLRWRLAVNRD